MNLDHSCTDTGREGFSLLAGAKAALEQLVNARREDSVAIVVYVTDGSSAADDDAEVCVLNLPDAKSELSSDR